MAQLFFLFDQNLEILKSFFYADLFLLNFISIDGQKNHQ